MTRSTLVLCLQNCNRVTALDSLQNLVFTQYFENEWTVLTKFCIRSFIDKNNIGIVNRCVLQICNRVTALDLRQNLGFTQYLENRMRPNIVYTLSLTRSMLVL